MSRWNDEVADELGRRWRAAAERELVLMEADADGQRPPAAERSAEEPPAPKRGRGATAAQPAAAVKGGSSNLKAAQAAGAAGAGAAGSGAAAAAADSDDEYEGVFDGADTVITCASQRDQAAQDGDDAADQGGDPNAARKNVAVSRKRKMNSHAPPVPTNPSPATLECIAATANMTEISSVSKPEVEAEVLLCSDDDCSEFDEPQTDNVLQADILSLRRSKRRWSLEMGHGMLRVDGVESLFSSAQALFEVEEELGPNSVPKQIDEQESTVDVDFTKTRRTGAEKHTRY